MRAMGQTAWLIALAMMCGCASSAAAQTPAPTSRSNSAQVGAGRTSQVRLVVMIVIDQLRADYLTRFTGQFGDAGFARLMRDGAHFRNAYFSYGSAATAPGHATIATGRLPRQHGIVANRWYSTTGGWRNAIDDDQCGPVGIDTAAGRGKSSRALIGPALGDQLRLSDARSRVFSIALKDRAAIFMGGLRPDLALWWEPSGGNWMSSTYYCRELPAYVRAFNASRWVDQFDGRSWGRLGPDEAYAGCMALRPTEIMEKYGLGAAFPHALPKRTAKDANRYYEAVLASPFGNDILLEMVGRVLHEEKLGQGPAVDLLCVGFSSNDYAGHAFGPESPEVKDMTLRTDSQLAGLLDTLDRNVGLERCLVVLTGDHGISTAPALAKARGLGGGYVDLGAITKELNSTLGDASGTAKSSAPAAGIELPWVFFKPDPEKRDGDVWAQEIERAAAYLESLEGVERAIAMTHAPGYEPSADDLPSRLAWRGYHAGRSGAIYLQLSPNWYKGKDTAAGHGTSFTTDRHVPILMMGPGVRAGVYFRPVDPIDIAPTVAMLLGIEPPVGAIGRVLDEAMQSARR